jgi:hypothetical protein
MRAILSVGVLLASLAAAACGDSQVGTVAPESVTTGGEIGGEAAPDFHLLLSDGSTFTLSEEARPVYLLFWAEW